jgi:rubrerythrin
MAYISGKETPAEIIIIAYGMEDGLRAFYEKMIEETEHQKISELFGKLAKIEVAHKKRLLRLYGEYRQGETDLHSFEDEESEKVMEGGLTVDEFISNNRSALETTVDVLAMAMTLEAQALDLYMRYAHRSEHHETREILFRTSEEEKTHLREIGSLLDKEFQKS